MQWLMIGIFVLLLGILYVLFENKNLQVNEYVLEQEQVLEAFHGMKLVCLTDLHNTSFGKNNAKLLKKIRDLKPDVILIAGDFIIAGNRKKNEVSIKLLEALAKEYPVYYSPGNHERNWMELEMEMLHSQANNHERDFSLEPNICNSYQFYIKQLQSLSINYLDNKSIFIKKGENTLQISGLNLPFSYFQKFKKPMELSVKELNAYLGKAEPDAYHILLAHIPVYFESYAKWGGDFVLSGHVHGGILRLPFLGGVISPQFELFPQYDSGIYSCGKTIMMLSRGLGTHTLPIRVFNRPELIAIELRKNNFHNK